MAVKILYSRMQQKYDTKTDWENATTFIPLKGEVIIGAESEPVSGQDSPNLEIRIGDGIHNYNNIPLIKSWADVKGYIDDELNYKVDKNDISIETGLGEKSIKMKTVDFENVLATIIPAMEAYLQMNPDVYQQLVAQGFGNTIPEVARNYVLYIFQTDFNVTPSDDFHNEAIEGAAIALGAGSRAYAPIGIAAGLRATSGEQYNAGSNVGAVSIGIDTTAKGVASVAVGNGAEANGRGAIVFGSKTTTNLQDFIDSGWDADGHCTKWFEALVDAGVIEDKFDDVDFGKAIGDYALALSRGLALEDGSIAAGIYAVASAENAQAFGNQTLASGVNAHSEGISTVASGQAAHSEGAATYATGDNAHAEGGYTEASGMRAHAEGGVTKATAVSAHAEGYSTQATADCAHAEGIRAVASGIYSHAEGMDTVASGGYSHAGGTNTKATANAQTAIGKYNEEDNDALFIVGNGTSDNDRSNAFAVKSNGDAVMSGVANYSSVPATKTDTQLVCHKELDDTTGDIDTALQGIIASQESYIAGTSYNRYRKIIDMTTTAETEAQIITLNKDDKGNPFVLERAKIFVFTPLDKNSDEGSNGYVNIRSRYVTGYGNYYGVISWLSNAHPLNNIAEIITHDDLPTYMQFNTSNWGAIAKYTDNSTSWGSELTTHKQIEGIRLYINGSTKKFWAGTRIVIFGVDKLNVD